MKTKKFWFVMAVAAVLTGMVFTSCSDDDDIITPPEVIESEVLESGCSSTVVEETGTEGTSLSYESWIYVRQTTRASSDNKISVTLFNRFNNVVEEVDVEDFNFGEPEIKFEHRVADSRVEQTYVTVTDSVLVYSLNYKNGFKLEYELMYETPEYNDGVTKQMMPYHSIGQITDNGMKLSGMEDQVVDGVKYFRKLIQHSITVNYNGKSYDVSASVVVRSEEPAEDILLASEKVNEGIELVSTDVENAKAVYRSWVEVKQTWSESGVKTFKKEVLLNYWAEMPNASSNWTVRNKYTTWDNFKTQLTNQDIATENGEFEDYVAIDTVTVSMLVEVTKEDDAEFNVPALIPCISERARYDDGVLKYDFLYKEYSYVSSSFELKEDWYLIEDEIWGDSWNATCIYNLKISLDEKEFSTSFEVPLVLE